MRDLRTTKREFTRVARRLVRQEAWSGTRPFRGVIQPAFGVWLREHWALSKPSWFQPVPKDLQKQQKTFELVNAPRPGRAGEIRFTFSPTIQLTSFPEHTSNSFFEIDGARVFQTLTPKRFSSETKSMLLRDSRTESITRTRANLAVNREIQSRQSTKIVELISSLFSTLSRAVGEIARSKPNERDFPPKPQRGDAITSFLTDLAPGRKNNVTTRLRNKFANTLQRNQFVGVSPQHNQFAGAFQPLVFASNSRKELPHANSVFAGASSTQRRLLKTTPLHLHVDQWLVMPRRGPQVDGEFRAAPKVFTTLVLDFAAPKAADTELVHQRIAQLVSSPALAYAKRQQAVSEGIIHALRELRTSQDEPKRVAAQVLPSIEQITSQVKTQLERELRIERERRGL